jgi:hypothetical protein
MQGFWTIEFGSSAGLYGSGVVVMRDGKIQGGDTSYYYDGSYEELVAPQDPRKFKAKIQIRPFSPDAMSIFRTFGENFSLDLEGELKDASHAVARGTLEGKPEMNLGVRLIRRGEAA